MARMGINQANAENMETKFTNLEKNMETKLGILEKNTETHMETRIADVETKMTNMKTDIEEKHDTVSNEVKELKTALVEAFDQMKDVLVEIDGKKEEIARKVRNAPSGDRETIIVAGGAGNDSVAMFNSRQRTWLALQSMPEKRYGATSFVYDNPVFIAGGSYGLFNYFDNMIRINVHPHPDISTHWS